MADGGVVPSEIEDPPIAHEVQIPVAAFVEQVGAFSAYVLAVEPDGAQHLHPHGGNVFTIYLKPVVTGFLYEVLKRRIHSDQPPVIVPSSMQLMRILASTPLVLVICSVRRYVGVGTPDDNGFATIRSALGLFEGHRRFPQNIHPAVCH